eukprot:5892096-Pyramimonas_sp.AAC.1
MGQLLHFHFVPQRTKVCSDLSRASFRADGAGRRSCRCRAPLHGSAAAARARARRALARTRVATASQWSVRGSP